MDNKESLVILKKAIGDGQTGGSKEGLWMLEPDDEEVIKLAIQALKKPETAVIKLAIQALKKPETAVNKLAIQALKKPETAVNKLARKNEEQIDLAQAMGVLKKELLEDQTPGSYYFGWQSNIACTIMDNSNIEHDQANMIAKKFLTLLTMDCE